MQFRESYYNYRYTIFLLFLTQNSSSVGEDRPVTHLIPWLNIHSLAEDFRFDRMHITQELMQVLR